MPHLRTLLIAGGALLLLVSAAQAHGGYWHPHRSHVIVRRIVRVRGPWRIAHCADGSRIRTRMHAGVCRRHGGLVAWED